MVTPKSPAFRDRFCAACREGPIIVPCSRIRVLDGSLPAPSNSRAEGMWNAQKTKPPFWPAHRVVNQTADTFGLRLIILRDETSDPLHGLAPLPAEFGSAIAFLVRRTLTPVPMPGMPTQLVQALRGTGQGGTLARSAAPSRLLLRAGSSGDGSTVALLPPCLPPLEEALVLPLGPAPAAAAAASAQPLRWRFGELVDAVAADASAAELMQLLVTPPTSPPAPPASPSTTEGVAAAGSASFARDAISLGFGGAVAAFAVYMGSEHAITRANVLAVAGVPTFLASALSLCLFLAPTHGGEPTFGAFQTRIFSLVACAWAYRAYSRVASARPVSDPFVEPALVAEVGGPVLCSLLTTVALLLAAGGVCTTRAVARGLLAVAGSGMLLLSSAIWVVSGGSARSYLPLQCNSYPVALVSISFFFYAAWWLTPENCRRLQAALQGGVGRVTQPARVTSIGHV